MKKTTDQIHSTAENLSIEMVGENDCGLFVRCFWSHDRFAHEIGLIAEQQRIPALKSKEGDSTHLWPCSPPLQQVHRQQVEECPVLFGVGMSGTSHYSTSILLANLGSAIGLQIESACVAKPDNSGGTPHLGSRMSWLPEFKLIEQQNQAKIIHQDGHLSAMVIVPDAGSSEFQQLADGQFEIGPSAISPSGTIQWKYQILLK